MKQLRIFFLMVITWLLIAAAPVLPTPPTPDPYPGPSPTPIGTPTRTPPPTAYPVITNTRHRTPTPVTPPSTPACYPYCPPPTGVDLTTIGSAKSSLPWIALLGAAAVLFIMGLFRLFKPANSASQNR